MKGPDLNFSLKLILYKPSWTSYKITIASCGNKSLKPWLWVSLVETLHKAPFWAEIKRSVGALKKGSNSIKSRLYHWPVKNRDLVRCKPVSRQLTTNGKLILDWDPRANMILARHLSTSHNRIFDVTTEYTFGSKIEYSWSNCLWLLVYWQVSWY